MTNDQMIAKLEEQRTQLGIAIAALRKASGARRKAAALVAAPVKSAATGLLPAKAKRRGRPPGSKNKLKK